MARIPLIFRKRAYLVFASFSGSDGLNLNAYTPEIGGVPTILAGAWSLLAGKARKTAAASTHQQAVWDVGRSDCLLAADMVLPAGGFECLGCRIVDQNNGWMLQLGESTAGVPNSCKLYEQNGAGAFTERASATVTLNAGTSYRVELEPRGSRIAGRVNGGSEIAYASATSHATATKHGLWSYSVNGDYDNLEIRR
jgi:hypothetical protein